MQWNAFFGESEYRILTQNSLTIRNGNILAAGYSANSWGTPVHAHNTGFDIYVLKVKVDNTPPVATQNIPLSLGWNLISFRIKPTNTNISSVLSSIEGSYDLVYTWDATGAHAGSGNWLKADNIPASPDSLTVLNETMGFWVHMLAADTLDVEGTVPTTTSVSLLTGAGGWNLVGYPSYTNQDLPDVLQDHGVGANFSLIYAYHANETSDVWKLFDLSTPPFANDLTQLTPGWGYWVKVSANSTWNVNYAP